MKAEELMIGDWVFNPHKTKNERISGITLSQIRLYGDIFRTRIYKPIPITPEILEKNRIKYHCLPSDGIHSKEEYYLWKDVINLKRDYIRIKNYGKLGWEVYASGGSKNPKGYIKHNDFKGFISYVHELQHIFKICGIEKEIEL